MNIIPILEKLPDIIVASTKEEKFINKNTLPFKVERIIDKKYYFIEDNQIVQMFDLGSPMSARRYEHHNYFNTREQAEIALENVQQCLKSLSNH